MKKEYDFSKGKRGPVIDDDVLEVLKEHLGQSRDPVDAATIRRIVREELRKTG